jgi:hypothetical protein
MIEGSGSIPLTSGSGSLRPKNMWIRIRNTALKAVLWNRNRRNRNYLPKWTGTGMHYGSGAGFRSGSNVKWNKKVKNERPIFWEIMLLLTWKGNILDKFCCWKTVLNIVWIRNQKRSGTRIAEKIILKMSRVSFAPRSYFKEILSTQNFGSGYAALDKCCFFPTGA